MNNLGKELKSITLIFSKYLGIPPLQTTDVREWWIHALGHLDKETIDSLYENFVDAPCWQVKMMKDDLLARKMELEMSEDPFPTHGELEEGERVLC
ncbi:hypothetical protein D5F11_016255 [Siminovitchia terrae]|uniref:Uncharacterized protein n=1 Tax=Siminovitchia terrae TaxID=1914933 RepID=A0A429X589_SIMTE|nr:hypothetical protein [Siminovitchia terrae]RST58586.1 hypothetical protein D5F11_016255 [Siminovitchia terrae]